MGGRYEDRRAPMYHHRMRSPPRYGPPPMDRRTDYPDYLRGLSHQPPPAYYSYPHHHPYPPPHTPLGAERGRKRRYEDDMGGHREKWRSSCVGLLIGRVKGTGTGA